MKRLAFLILSCLILYSCSANTFSPDSYPQKWELIKMNGSMIPSETTGADMAWQESYVLYSDHTFLKSRRQNAKVLEAKGTYTVDNTKNRTRLVLSYQSENDIIGNCTSDPEEHLYFSTHSKLVNDWAMCDGPALEYKRVE